MREDTLLALLKRKRGLFEAILELSTEEARLSLSEWIDSLEQKKILLSCIEEIDVQLMPFKQKLQNISQDIANELDTIRDVIRHILHLDKINQEKRKHEIQLQEKKKRE